MVQFMALIMRMHDLFRIDYNSGNRAPVAAISTNDTIGIAPFKVTLDANKSKDLDDDDQLITSGS